MHTSIKPRNLWNFETSSFSIADRFDNLVLLTRSINGGFGSGMVVEGLGFVLNNRMPYFNLDTDDVNVLIGENRRRHTTNPALALKNGLPYLAWSTPSGDNQVKAMPQAFLALFQFGAGGLNQTAWWCPQRGSVGGKSGASPGPPPLSHLPRSVEFIDRRFTRALVLP